MDCLDPTASMSGASEGPPTWGGIWGPPKTPTPSEAGEGEAATAGAVFGPGPGNAGKSSLDIVNSEDSMVGCLTIPTVLTKKKGKR